MNITINRFIAGVLGVLLLGFGLSRLPDGTALASPSSITKTASSTTYAITTAASVRIHATSTRTHTLSVRPICSPNTVVYLRSEYDKPATAATGMAITASSTAPTIMGDQAEIPLSYGSITAITTGGSCDLNVTEWRDNF